MSKIPDILGRTFLVLPLIIIWWLLTLTFITPFLFWIFTGSHNKWESLNDKILGH